jgi:hypothetical protein
MFQQIAEAVVSGGLAGGLVGLAVTWDADRRERARARAEQDRREAPDQLKQASHGMGAIVYRCTPLDVAEARLQWEPPGRTSHGW